MKRVVKCRCAWCNTDMGVVSADFTDGSMITHGICPACAEMISNDLKKKKSCGISGERNQNLSSGKLLQ